MNRVSVSALLSLLLLLTGGCKSKTDNTEAIRAAVVKRLAGMNGLNVNNMIITVTKATINGDKAQADVDVRAKSGTPNAPAMELTYDLEKQNGEWVVLKGQAIGGMQHPSAGEMPQGNLPPGHPAMGDNSQPGSHPDFNSILNGAQPPPQTQQQGTSQQPT
ncbi:MAG: hypothetical protein WBU20_22260, partial [Candidatus Acidiferrum sp.]